ncbi:endonuclease/exonuclease/phosphatase family protein [Opitutales bacterium ASA1]|uniref:endonuclease/exonuclease/phosphatase family protein n=1 Tax=Congregicoccus parvus TaxID=3081749 RepID=UPI002B2D2A60|nr:endonuclease/exonuclease/phosphatase family protein [Opitutales bacterium ASA1]
MPRYLTLVALAAAFSSLTASTASTTRELGLMTFNIRLDLASDGPDAWPNRKDFVTDVIDGARVEIVGLQEALQHQLDHVVSTLPRFASAGEARGGAGKDEYSAVLYDAEGLQLLESRTFWLSDTPDVPSTSWGNRHLRICTWVRLRDRETGTCLHVFNTHLDHESENARVRGVRLILERVREWSRGEPVVLMGDFNASASSDPVRLVVAGGDEPRLRDAFRILHPDTPEPGTFNAFVGRDDGRMIDFVFVSAGVEVLAAEIVRTQRDGRFPSDHFPVTARIRLP